MSNGTFEIKTFKEHVRQRSMWIGDKQPIATNCFTVKFTDKKITFNNEKVLYSEALLKTYDELIVNAIDQWVLGHCEEINISYSSGDGTFTITNIGSAMPIYFIDDKKKWTVELLLTNEYCGTNFQDTPNKVVGGMNGLGLKLVVLHSEYFSIRTNNKESEYYQEILGGDNILDPIITSKIKDINVTTITYKPKLSYFSGIKCDISLLNLRIVQTIIFTNTITHRYDDRVIKLPKLKLTYNDNKFIDLALDKFIKLIYPINKKYVYIVFNNTQHHFPWYIVIIENPYQKHKSMSIINGIYLKDSSHLSILTKQIYLYIKDVKKIDVSETIIQSSLFYFDCKHIPVIGFSSQSKTTFQLNKKVKDEMKKSFILTNKQLEDIYLLIANRLKSKTKKPTGPEIDFTLLHNKVTVPSKKGPSSVLIICEGESAFGAIENMVLSNKVKTSIVNKEHFGAFSLNGVPLNVQKTELSDNKTLLYLMKFIGLELNIPFNKDHLKFGKIILVTDEDVDGKGHICSLILVFFITFWPELFHHNIIQRLKTPIIRVYSRNTHHNIYSLDDYKEMELSGNCQVNYYKGLATHSNKEIHEIAETFKLNLYTFQLTNTCIETMKTYYGDDTNKRKIILSNYTKHTYNPDNYKRNIITCSDHFNVETKEFQHEFLNRKIPNYNDGMIESQRKAFCCIRKHKNDKKKIYEFTGIIASNMKYAHGDKSMNDTITKMAQTYTGTNNIPYFIPISNNFGSRKRSRSHFAQARYLSTKYNKIMNKLYPLHDDNLLEYVYEEGEKCQPIYYVSILPMSILETYTTPTAGWICVKYGRDLLSIIDFVKRKINGDHDSDDEIAPWIRSNIIGIKCVCCKSNDIFPIRYKNVGDKEIYYGDYRIVNNSIHVLQLPPKIWEDTFINGIRESTICDDCSLNIPHDKTKCNAVKIIKNIETYSEFDTIHIIITFIDSNIIKKIQYYTTPRYGLDPIIEFLGMYDVITPHINLLDENNVLREFTSYTEVINKWFDMRFDLYNKRCEREKILLELRILLYKNKRRFIELEITNEINVDKKSMSEINIILSHNNFPLIDEWLLENNSDIKTDKLRERIVPTSLDCNKYYSYIYKITIVGKSIDEINKLDLIIKELEHSLLNYPTSRELWIKEIDEVVSDILHGYNTYWDN